MTTHLGRPAATDLPAAERSVPPPVPSTGPAPAPAPAPARHPLDPLTAAEVERAADVVAGARLMPSTAKFVMITLDEPTREALAPDAPGTPDRRAFLTVYDRAEHLLTEAVVSLDTGTVLSTTPKPGRMPSFIGEDLLEAEELVRRDPRWLAALRKRGFTDPGLAMIDTWPSGFTGPGDDPRTGPLMCRALTFMRTAEGEHGYARPLEGLIVTVDVDAMTVLEVADHGIVTTPPTAGNYEDEWMFDPGNRPALDGPRTDLKPIEITQPEGPSFTVDGWGVQWQKWSLRVGFNPREGLVLHQVGYRDKGVLRSVLERASLSEMVVPYGDSAPTHWNKNVFDMGEVGMGLMANPLELGCDCLGHIHYFDGVVNSGLGRAVVVKNAVCMHEEDVGISWKHTDARTQRVEVRRSRRLVISTIATVGNYEYGFFWYLYTDGTIEYDVKLTGVLTTGAIEAGEQPRYGQLVAPGLYGPNHQHFFSVRLEMAVDGPRNTVHEIDSVPEPDPALDPHHNAWTTRATPVRSEASGARDHSYGTARFWKVVNPDRVNELGQAVGYELLHSAPVAPMVREGSAVFDRARFLQHGLWVTAYDREQRYASGDYPYQSPEAQGLPEFVTDDAPLENTALVLWVTVGAHHVARPEDWPVMPVVHAGFHLKPVGFFDGNPALDMPRSAPAGSHAAHAGLPGDPHTCC